MRKKFVQNSGFVIVSAVVLALLASIFAHPAEAQLRGIGAGAIVLDDYNGHTVSIQAPVFGSPEGNAWSAISYAPLTWNVPVPPANNAQSGFVYVGPLTPITGPYPSTTTVPYWLYPNQTSLSGDGHTGGSAGAWDYATTAQLGILASIAPLGNNEAIITDGSGNVKTIANGGDNTLLHGTTPPSWSGVALGADVTGMLPIANGGTGQTTANAALNALLPSQAGNAGDFLTTNATNASWAPLGSLLVTSFSAGTTGFTPNTATNGAITLAGTLNVANGGTGATTAGGARTNLGAAASGANRDITSLTGLTTAIPITEGGTGQTTANAAFNALAPSQATNSGDVLTTNGTTTSWEPLSGVTVTSFSAGTTGFTPNTATNGSITLAGTLNVANGGTGATTAGGARTNLGAAASGANSDITSLTGLTTAIPVTEGGTGATTAGGARTNLGAAASGANSDITSLTGLTTALPVSEGGSGDVTHTAHGLLVGEGAGAVASTVAGTAGQILTSGGAAADPGWTTLSAVAVTSFSAGTTGLTPNTATTGPVTLAGTLNVANGGTGATTAGGARTNLGAAASGANSDITSLTGLTTALPISEGGTGQTTANAALNALLPSQAGNAGDFLTTNATNASWAPLGSLLVTSFSAGTTGFTPNTATNGAITLAGTLNVANGGTGATTAGGARTNLGAAASGANSDITSLTGLTTALPITEGGTGQTTANAAFNALAPSQATNSGDVLTTNGTTTSWEPLSGVTVTSFSAGTTGFTPNTATNGSITLAGTLNVANGGTGATTAGGARTNLGAAASGANSDITSLTGLTTAIPVTEGGTGATTAGGARTNLGAAASGANSDITSLTGLTTALPVSEGGSGDVTHTAHGLLVGEGAGAVASTVAGTAGQILTSGGAAADPGWTTLNSVAVTTFSAGTTGFTPNTATNGAITLAGTLNVANGGTGATTAGGARTNLGAAASGANSDITSLTGLTTALPITEGGTGQTTANAAFNALAPSQATNSGDVLTTNGTTTSWEPLSGVTVTSFSAGTTGFTPNTATNGSITLAGTLNVANGGTGATTAGGARTNLGAAASGANSDITSLTGLTTALPVSEGGSGDVTHTAHGLLVGEGAGAVASTVAGTAGQILTSGGAAADPGWTTLNSVAVTTFSAGTTGFTPNTATNGAITLAGTLNVANGGTGATTAGGARTNLGAAASGANSDITSLTGITTAIPLTEGGTGATTAGGARINLGAAASGANSDITSLTGLTTALPITEGGTGQTTANAAFNALAPSQATNSGDVLTTNGTTTSWEPLSGVTVTSFSAGTTGFTPNTATNGSITLAGTLNVANGGTGATTAPLARASLGAAASGANSDITSLTGLTIALPVSEGGTGAATVATANQFFANTTAASAPGFRSIVAGDLPDLSGLYLPLAGGTMSGNIAMGGNSITGALNITATGAFTGGTGSFTTLAVAPGATNVTSMTVTQTTAAVPSSPIFIIENQAGNKYFTVGKNGSQVSFGDQNVQAQIGIHHSATAGIVTQVTSSETATTRNIAFPDESGTIALTTAGVNSDITSITGLTTALPISEGGTGQTTANTAFNALAPSQATNSGDVLTTNGTNTSWESLTGVAVTTFSAGSTGFTPNTATSGAITLAGTLNVANGGTGATTAGGARTSLGAAASGANGDITSLTGLSTALPATEGGTGFGSYTVGDILYASTTTALSKLGVASGSPGNVLTISVGGLPVWSPPVSGPNGVLYNVAPASAQITAATGNELFDVEYPSAGVASALGATIKSIATAGGSATGLSVSATGSSTAGVNNAIVATFLPAANSTGVSIDGTAAPVAGSVGIAVGLAAGANAPDVAAHFNGGLSNDLLLGGGYSNAGSYALQFIGSGTDVTDAAIGVTGNYSNGYLANSTVSGIYGKTSATTVISVPGTAHFGAFTGSFGVRGEATGNAHGPRVIGVWGLASGNDGLNTGSVGVRAQGQGLTGVGNTNVALEATNGEFTMGRTTDPNAQDDGSTTPVNAANLEGPSGMVNLATTFAANSGNTIHEQNFTVGNEYCSSKSIVLVTVQNDADAGKSTYTAQAVPGSGQFTVVLTQSVLASATSTANPTVTVGYIIINPSR